MLVGLRSAPCIAAEVPSSEQDYRLAAAIADYYIKSFPSEGGVTETETEKEHAAHEIRPAELGEKTKREVVFNSIFAKSKKYAFLQENMTPVLNQYAWGDLHLFYGTTSERASHLMSRINRTVTVLGESVLATLLVTPTSNLEELARRQRIIQIFLDSTEEVDRLKASLRRYQEAEQSVLSLWTPTDPLYTKEYGKYMDDYFYTKNDEKANKNSGWLEFKKRFFRDFLGIQYRILWPVTILFTQEIFASKAMSRPFLGPGTISPTVRKFSWIGGNTLLWRMVQMEPAEKIDSKATESLGVMIILGETFYTWQAYQCIRNYLEYSSVLRNLALRMARCAGLYDGCYRSECMCSCLANARNRIWSTTHQYEKPAGKSPREHRTREASELPKNASL
jgi:DNA mismatch repair protein MutS